MVASIARNRGQATADERAFDEALATIVDGGWPDAIPAGYGEELMTAKTVSTYLAQTESTPPGMTERTRRTIAEGVAARERRTATSRPARFAAAGLAALLLAASVLTPLGGRARAAADEFIFEVVGGGPFTGVVELVTGRSNGDGTVTMIDAEGNEMGTLRMLEMSEVTVIPGDGDVTLEVAE